MLKPDAARRELGAFKSERHLQARLARLRKLPKAAAAAGFGLFSLLPDGKEPKDWQTTYLVQQRSQRILGGDAGLRQTVLAALYPTFAKEIAQGLRVIARLSYTTGPNRRPYRAPGRPEFLAAKI